MHIDVGGVTSRKKRKHRKGKRKQKISTTKEKELSKTFGKKKNMKAEEMKQNVGK